MTPSARRTLMALSLSVACAGSFAACGGGEDYRVTLDLENAGGLRQGSLVQVAGVPVGEVTDLKLRDDDRVQALLKLDSAEGPIGQDARAAIASRNLLGEKYVNLTAGDRRRPLESGATLAADRVQQSVDLDQVLDVLAPDARAKVSVLISEVGAGLTGQGANLNSFLRQFPASLDKATQLLDQVVGDNRSLGDVVERSDRFIATLARERRTLVGLVDTAGRASESVAAKRAELIQTLERAPGTLAALRGTLAEVRATAGPLGEGARAISAAAPALTDTLDAVEPFRRNATPALRELRAAAPALTRLGRQATPVVRRANPTLESLRGFSTSLAPVTRTLDVMIDDLMAALHGWSRAIQARDGISHMFRAKVMVNPESLNSVITRLTGPETRKKTTTSPPRREPQKTPATKDVLPMLTPRPSAPKPPSVLEPVAPLLDSIGKPAERAVDDLFDFLLAP